MVLISLIRVWAASCLTVLPACLAAAVGKVKSAAAATAQQQQRRQQQAAATAVPQIQLPQVQMPPDLQQRQQQLARPVQQQLALTAAKCFVAAAAATACNSNHQLGTCKNRGQCIGVNSCISSSMGQCKAGCVCSAHSFSSVSAVAAMH